LQKVLGSPSVEDDGALSKREREVLGLIAQGHTNQSIAATLGLSVKTIETFRARIIAKTGLNKRSDMVRYAKQRGLDTIAVASDGAATAKKRSGKKRRQK
jgi:DNA-binding CsgD family transcriptional regulator